VRACARTAGTTPVSTLLGVFAALIHRVGGRDDFVIGIPTNGRPNPALRTLVASLATPVAIRVRVDETATISDLCRSVQATVFEALDRPVPIDAVARHVARRTGVLAPVTPVMFNFDPIPEVPAFADGTTMRIGNPERTFGLVPFSAEACPVNDGSVSFSFDASSSMYDPAMVECWADYFMTLIDTLPAHLDAAVADVALRSHGR
jgi:non-ribosomal peptide synthetase component F